MESKSDREHVINKYKNGFLDVGEYQLGNFATLLSCSVAVVIPFERLFKTSNFSGILNSRKSLLDPHSAVGISYTLL